MLGNAHIHPTMPVVDFERAKKFYTEKLGLRVTKEDDYPGAVLEAGDGTYLYIYKREATKADHTAMSFTVDDVLKTVNGLKEKGVEFQDVDIPGIDKVDGIYVFKDMKVAWFQDTEGNTLGISNM